MDEKQEAIVRNVERHLYIIEEQFSNFERELFKGGDNFEKQLKQDLLDQNRNLTAIGNALLVMVFIIILMLGALIWLQLGSTIWNAYQLPKMD